MGRMQEIGRKLKSDPTIQGAIALPMTGVSIGWIVGDFMQDKGSPTHVLLGVVMLLAAATIMRYNITFDSERRDARFFQSLALRYAEMLDENEKENK